jgi:hypothetical protein
MDTRSESKTKSTAESGCNIRPDMTSAFHVKH